MKNGRQQKMISSKEENIEKINKHISEKGLTFSAFVINAAIEEIDKESPNSLSISFSDEEWEKIAEAEKTMRSDKKVLAKSAILRDVDLILDRFL